MTLDEDLHNLVIIGGITIGKKLYHSDGRLFIDDVTPWNGLARLVRREGRDRTIASVKRALQSAEERIEDLTAGGESTDACALRTRRLGMIHNALENIPVGLDNLKFTYVSDTSVQAALDLLRRQAFSIIRRLDELMPSDRCHEG